MKIQLYEIDLDVSNSTAEYNGSVRITADLNGEDLALDSVGLDINKVRIDDKDASFSTGNDQLLIDGKFQGKKVIHIQFYGKVTPLLTGFYRATAPDGLEMFTTQFESTGARRAFPCFDRPDVKASFRLAVSVDEGYDVISNMPVKEKKTQSGRTNFSFEDTPRMSTYLLYIGVGKLEIREFDNNGKKIRLVGLKGRLDTTDFPLNVGVRTLDYFNGYFEIPYQLPKVDLIAVPQFAAGAMENWGAITFRESLLMVNKSTSLRAKKRILEVIAHELTHQWFGDLVTMKWWNDLWLNESFATFMSYKASEKLYPEWKMFDYFIISRMEPAFHGDALLSSHPIDVEVKDPASISQIFDEISYGKGGCILRMIEGYVGDEIFRKGIQKYLNDNSYSNAEGSALTNSIEKFFNGNVTGIMEKWIKRMGYPMVTASPKGNNIHLSQARFLLSGPVEEEPWPIPLTVRRGESQESVLFSTRSISIKDEGFTCLNAGRKGFYRVLYVGDLFDRVLGNIPKMSREERQGLISDYFAFFRSGVAGWDQYSKVLLRLFEDSERLVITTISNQLHLLHLLKPKSEEISKMGRKFHELQYKRLSQSDSEENQETLGLVSERLAIFDDSFARKEARKFEAIESVKPDLRLSVAISKAVTDGDPTGMIGMLRALRSDEDRVKILTALGFIPGENTVDQVIKLINEGTVKKQDMSTYFDSAVSNPANGRFIVNKAREMVEMISTVFVGNINASRFVEGFLPLAGTRYPEDVAKFVENIRGIKEAQRGITKGTEVLKANMKLLDRIPA
ncbi:MAG: M1 family metallopeptidase [Candidatus Thermoplasmatota archaeon]|jgi:tricorn protease interacting factor F2/3|nr:M1 family metallopeptidase [Candidatus Thermoplasmatota archaeon]MCL5794045.1 M1 family metallopeptidase [Candidatus Thermoplasmatota archaeon]